MKNNNSQVNTKNVVRNSNKTNNKKLIKHKQIKEKKTRVRNINDNNGKFRMQLLMIACVMVIIFSIFTYQQYQNDQNYNKYKQDTSKDLIYTKYEIKTNDYKKEMPYVNIRSIIVQKINKDIELFFNKYKDKETSVITYEYNVSDMILSIILKEKDMDEDTYKEPNFRTYNINLDTMELIADEPLLDYFKITKKEIEEKVALSVQDKYLKLVKSSLINEQECNYECYLKQSNISFDPNSSKYYVKDSKLYVYKSYIDYFEKKQTKFNDKEFKFLIINVELQ